MQNTTFSFKQLTGFISLGGMSYAFTGGEGLGGITFTPLTEKTTHNRAADGTIMPNFIAGDNADVVIEVQQTSAFHQFMMNAFNVLNAAGGVGWADGAGSFRHMVTGNSYIATGLSFKQDASEPYHVEGEMITWNLMACEYHSMTA